MPLVNSTRSIFYKGLLDFATSPVPNFLRNYDYFCPLNCPLIFLEIWWCPFIFRNFFPVYDIGKNARRTYMLIQTLLFDWSIFCIQYSFCGTPWFGIVFGRNKALKMACASVIIVSLNFLSSTSLCPLVFRKFQLCPL